MVLNLDPKTFFHGFYLHYILEIVPRFHCMQFQGKLRKTWENDRKPNFGTNFGPFDPHLHFKKIFSWILPLLYVRHCCKISLSGIWRKTYKPNLRKWRKNLYQDRFWPLWRKFGSQKLFHGFYLYYMLGFVASYYCMQFQAKLICQTWENSKKPTSGTILAPLVQILARNFFQKFYLYYILDIVASYHCMQFQGKLIKQIWENGEKALFIF